MHPIKEGFRAKGFDFVYAFFEQYGEVCCLGSIDNGGIVVVLLAYNKVANLLDAFDKFLIFKTLVIGVDSCADKFGGLS